VQRIGERERGYVLEVLDHQFRASRHHLFNARLEKAMASLHDRAFALSLVNGTAALHTAIAALDIGPGDEVVVPPLTMGSTSLCVLQAGATPVFADVNPRTFNIDPTAVRSVVTNKTRAIISVGLYGLAPDYDGLLDICQERDIALIEDNAECLFATYKGKLCGTFGTLAAFSLQASKHLTSGEGGILLLSDADLAERARSFSCLGYSSLGCEKTTITKQDVQSPQFVRHTMLGFNYRMPELCAAVGLAQVERATELVGPRQCAAQGFLNAASGFNWIRPQFVPEECSNTYWTCAMALDDSVDAAEWATLHQQFIQAGGEGFYAAWRLTYREPLFDSLLATGSLPTPNCPSAERVQPRIVQLSTNHWHEHEAHRQAEAFHAALRAIDEAGGG